MRTFVKDPDAVLDYGWDWSDWLEEGDSIDSFEIDVPAGLTMIGTGSEIDGVVTAWLGGGTNNKAYVVGCEITTVATRKDERSILLEIQER